MRASLLLRASGGLVFKLVKCLLVTVQVNGSSPEGKVLIVVNIMVHRAGCQGLLRDRENFSVWPFPEPFMSKISVIQNFPF